MDIEDYLSDHSSNSYDEENSDNSLSDSSFSQSSDSEESSFSETSDSSNEQIENDFEWLAYTKKSKLDVLIPDFQEDSGVYKQLKGIFQPIQALQLFLDDSFFTRMCTLVDIYYKAKKETHKKKSHHKVYTKPTIAEMKLFYGILIFMGINKLPSVRMYWSSNNCFLNISLKKLMTMERFYEIRSCLNFNRSLQNVNQDPVNKIQLLVNQLVQKFQKYYHPKNNLTIDETMVKFQGRHRFKVYMPLKPTKYGFKGYVLTESESGYVLNWSLYDGKKRTLIQIIDNLIMNYKNKGYTLFFDRFYSTLSVLEYLTKEGFFVFCAIIKNRAKITPEFNDIIQKLERFQSLFYISKNRKLLLQFLKVRHLGIWTRPRAEL